MKAFMFDIESARCIPLPAGVAVEATAIGDTAYFLSERFGFGDCIAALPDQAPATLLILEEEPTEAGLFENAARWIQHGIDRQAMILLYPQSPTGRTVLLWPDRRATLEGCTAQPPAAGTDPRTGALSFLIAVGQALETPESVRVSHRIA